MMLEDTLVDSVVSLYKEHKWKEIIERHHDAIDRNKVLWVFPSEDNLEFLSENLKKINAESIVSVGCGSGLLEWIIQEALSIPVKGIEVDGAWWNCKYAPPAFLPLHFAQENLESDTETKTILNANNTALLFCYFNNGPAFQQYMHNFNGNILVIIGPGEGRNTHTNPTPFNPELNKNTWQLAQSQEVRASKDFIAIYTRQI